MECFFFSGLNVPEQRTPMTQMTRRTLFVFALLCASLRPAWGQSDSGNALSVEMQRAVTSDSLHVLYVAIPRVGTLDRTLFTGDVYADSDINFSDYKYVGDLLSTTAGIFIRDLGSPGQLNGITIGGVDGRGIAFMSDGILLNEPLTGIFNPHLLPTENIERLEVISGTQSFLYGLNSTGGAINVITKSKKALHPYSRLRYSESGYDYGYIDGLVSQDIIRGFNVTMGFQHVTSGVRFPNSDDDSWNGRIKLRYNLSSRLNLFLSEDYNQTRLGLNGGVDTTTPADLRYDMFGAILRNTDSYEKITRHDLQLGAAVRAFDDSAAVSTLTIYHSTNFREYRDEENRPFSNGIFETE
jgi:outer membrane cobalamin receptor